MYKMKYISFIIINLLFLSIHTSGKAQENITEGQTIFKSRCASCHAVDKRLVGPALKDVYNRHDEQWIIDFVHSSQTLIKKGDETALKLFDEYNQTIMPDHKDLTEKQIKNILAYIKDESTQVPIVSKGYVPEFTKPYRDKKSIIDKIVYLNFDEPQKPIKPEDTVSWVLIATIIVLLGVFFYVIAFLNHFMDVYVKEIEFQKKEDGDKNNIERTINR